MNAQVPYERDLAHRIALTRLVARCALGAVWIYEGLVPKLLFPHHHPEQTALVAQSLFLIHSPRATLTLLGIVQIILGLLLVSGWRDRALSLLVTAFMAVLIVLVAAGRPSMLTDPFGALAKDLCLLACAAVPWLLPKPQT